MIIISPLSTNATDILQIKLSIQNQNLTKFLAEIVASLQILLYPYRRPWWLERGGTTRSLPEHGSETPQRLRYFLGNEVGK